MYSLQRSSTGRIAYRLREPWSDGVTYDFERAMHTFERYLERFNRDTTRKLEIRLDVGALSGVPDAVRRSLIEKYNPEFYFYYGGLPVIPSALGGFKNLTRLELGGFGFERQADWQLSCLREMSRLSYLSLARNSLPQCPIPSGLSRLETLIIAENPIARIDFGRLLSETKLTYLNLHSTPLHDFDELWDAGFEKEMEVLRANGTLIWLDHSEEGPHRETYSDDTYDVYDLYRLPSKGPALRLQRINYHPPIVQQSDVALWRRRAE